MKTKLFTLKKNSVSKNYTRKQLLLNAAEETAAWFLIGGFFLAIFWLIENFF